jgi:penicillin amidase
MSRQSLWRGQAIRTIIDATAERAGVQPPGDMEALTALRHRIETFDRNQGVGASGLDFFVVPGIANPPARRDYLLLRSLVRTLDLLAGDAFAPAFQRSTRQEDYRWGRLHRGILTHTLGGAFTVPPAFGESGIPGSPFYLNLLGRWLTNDAFPLLASPEGVGPVRHR